MDHAVQWRADATSILRRVLEAILLITIATGPSATSTAVAAEDLHEEAYSPSGSAVERLVQAIKTKDVPAADAALKSIRALRAEKAAITAVGSLLSSEDNDIRCVAADAVRQFDASKAAGLLSAFEWGLKSKEPRIRMHGALGLAQIGPAARKALPALLQAVRDEDIRVRASAAQALGSIGSAAVEAIPALEDLLNDPAFPVRAYSIRALPRSALRARRRFPACYGPCSNLTAANFARRRRRPSPDSAPRPKWPLPHWSHG